MAPGHDYTAFLVACSCAPGIVVVLGNAETGAREIFGIKTKSQLLAFIANRGLERPKFINRKPWKNRPGHLVDAYEFYSGETPGYISICFDPLPGRWFVKSFKKNINPTEIRNTPFATALRGYLPR